MQSFEYVWDIEVHVTKTGRGGKGVNHCSKENAYCLLIPGTSDIYNIANAEWRVCGAINGRIGTQTLKGEERFGFNWNYYIHSEKHSLKEIVFTQSPVNI